MYRINYQNSELPPLASTILEPPNLALNST